MTISQSDIEDAAARPKRVQTEEGEAEERSVGELIQADRYGAARSSSDKVPWGLRVARVRPGGTVT